MMRDQKKQHEELSIDRSTRGDSEDDKGEGGLRSEQTRKDGEASSLYSVSLDSRMFDVFFDETGVG